MAGIKDIYRSPDAFRFPTWDAAVSYPVNSIVNYYDSDAGGKWRHYIAKQQSIAGDLDSDIRFDFWTEMVFDSDALFVATNKAVLNNIGTITADIDSDIQVQLASLDSDLDSDIAVFRVEIKTDLDSDFSEQTKYVDSEIKILRADIDSEVVVLNAKVDENTRVFSYGRIYDSENYVADTVTQRLTNKAQFGASGEQMTADFYDATNKITKAFSFGSSGSQRYGTRFSNEEEAGHIALAIPDSETITAFTNSSYVDTFSFQGVRDELGGGYFASAEAVFTYSDTTTATVINRNAVDNNEARIELINPNPSKPVTNIVVKAYDRSSVEPGVNKIAINSVIQAQQVKTERASIFTFANAQVLKSYPPHDDVLAFVRNSKTLFVSRDSEWVTVDPRFDYAAATLSELETNWPALSESNYKRAIITNNRAEYFVLNQQWKIDSDSISADDDSDREIRIDSDLGSLLVKYQRLDSDFSVYQQVFNDQYFTSVYQDQDSDIRIIKAAFNTFYTEFVTLRAEHDRHTFGIDSDVSDIKSDFIQFKVDVNTANANSDSDLTVAIASIPTVVSQQINVYTTDHDSDIGELESQIAANFDYTAQLKQHEVANNDSDIRVLEYRLGDRDSDINYLLDRGLKYKGFIDHTVTGPGLNAQKGDVYQTNTVGWSVGGNLWPGIDSEFLDVDTLLMFNDSDEWMVLGGTGTVSNQTTVTAGFPAGTILSFSSLEYIPDSFRVCDGSFYDRNVYKELYSILQTDLLPDLRNEFLRGWNNDSDGFGNTRLILSNQSEEIKSHTHPYVEYTANGGGDDVLDGSNDFAVDTVNNILNNRTTSATGGDETRPTNTNVIFAIAMYSGAGAQFAGDSDLFRIAADHDSDITALEIRVTDHDSELLRLEHDRKSIDSDVLLRLDQQQDYDSELQIQVNDNDSDIEVLRTDVDTLLVIASLVQNNKTRTIDSDGPMIKGATYDITANVIGNIVPEDYSYPQITVYYSSFGTQINPTKKGRLLNGKLDTPEVIPSVIHDGTGALTVALYADSEVQHDIQIVSTFRKK